MMNCNDDGGGGGGDGGVGGGDYGTTVDAEARGVGLSSLFADHC